MKKLLSITAISLLLSGCLNSVSLPNSNGYSFSSIQLSPDEIRGVGLYLSIARACIDSGAKTAKQWEYLLSYVGDFSKQLDRELQRKIFDAITGYYGTYMKEKHIPRTEDNFEKLFNRRLSDKKLAYDVAQAFLKLSDRNLCGDVNEADANFKQFVARKMR